MANCDSSGEHESKAKEKPKGQPDVHRRKLPPDPRDIAAESEPPLRQGSCVLGRPRVAEIVQNSLLYFEGERYVLQAWCIMPNHAHVVVTPFDGHEVSTILRSWKSYTANPINRLLGRRGTLWERESFDHLCRKEESVTRFVEYTLSNPVEAGLCGTPEDWRFSSCGIGFQPAPYEFVDPCSTPFVEIQDRGELPHLHKPGGTYFVTVRLFDAIDVKRG